MSRWLFLAMLVTLLAWADGDETSSETFTGERGGVVTAQPTLNVRANPGQRYEAVAQLQSGAQVVAVERRGEWLGIVAPADAAAWVPLKQVVNGRIAADHVPLYSGPGVFYSTYRTLDKGTPVKVLQEKEDLWARVSPPPGTVAWVHADFIKLDPLPGTAKPVPVAGDPQPVEPPPAAPEGTTVAPAPGPAANATMETIGIAEPGERIGYVIPLGTPQGPWTYAIAHKVNGTYYPYAYLDKEAAELPKWAWKRVLIHGTVQWLQGWPRPRLTIEKIEAAPADE